MSEIVTKRILMVIGLGTMAPIIGLFAPAILLLIQEVPEPFDHSLAIFYVQHWAAMAVCFGAMIVYAASHPEVRPLVMGAAGVEKLILVILTGFQWTNPEVNGMKIAAVFDFLSVCFFVYYLRNVQKN